MSAGSQPRIAFVGWNTFQFLHFSRIARQFPGSAFIVEKRKKSFEVFASGPFEDLDVGILELDRPQMEAIDGEYDVLVCQTPFAGMERIRKSRIAMLQYGYAKEAHNFAPWRAFGDVCMTFGAYASRKIEPFCPAIATGNPRYDGWTTSTFRDRAMATHGQRLDPSRKTILYAPTWGELSSSSHFDGAVLALAADYNLILKIHHNSLLEGNPFAGAAGKPFITVCGADDDLVELLAISDGMISDYSGAIFDAIHCRVPVILLNHSEAGVHASAKSDGFSLEQARRDELGHQVSQASALGPAVAETIAAAASWIKRLEPFRSDLFTDTDDATGQACRVLHDLHAGLYHQNQTQQYIRTEMRNYYTCRRELSSARTFSGFLSMLDREIRKKLPGS